MTKPYASNSIPVQIGDLRIDFTAGSSVFSAASHWETAVHFHNGYEFHYLHAGEAGLILPDGMRIILRSRDACVIPPGLSHHIEQYSDRVLHFAASFSFSHRATEAQRPFSEYAHYRGLFEAHDTIGVFAGETLFPYIEKLNDLYDQSGPAAAHMIEIYLSVFFLEMSALHGRSLNGQADASPESCAAEDRNDTDSNRRWIIESYIADHYMQDRQLEELAEILHLSRSQTTRIIKKVMGRTLSKLIARQRMEVARMLIHSSSLSMEQIAARVGYRTYNGFYVAVKKYHRTTPEALRKEHNST